MPSWRTLRDVAPGIAEDFAAPRLGNGHNAQLVGVTDTIGLDRRDLISW
jgi:hypothetical protein